MILITCLKGEHNSPSYLLNEKLEVIKQFKNTYKKGEYALSIQKILNSNIKHVFAESLEDGIRRINVNINFELLKESRKGKPFFTNEEVDIMFNEIMKGI